ncbi:MAG TPA: MFS transporter [Clostridiaceae bacterium]|nr:MFS transporter [Clostridiaceae bacterium]
MHWITVLVVFCALASMWGATLNSSSLFISPMQESLGATRAEMVIGVTVKGIGSIIGSFFCAYILRKIQVVKLLRIGGLLLVGSVLALSFVQNIPQYYFVLAIQSVIISIGGYIPFSIVIQNWFEKKTSVAMGLAFMGSGFGGIVYNWLGGIWIPSLGWRHTYVIFSIITLVILLITLSIVRATPFHFGLKPMGAEDNGTISEPVEQELLVGAEVIDELKSVRFWMLMLAIFLLAMGSNALFYNVSPHLIDSGYSLTQAARISSAMMVFLMFGKPVVGYSFDRFGITTTSIISTMLMALGLVSAIFISHKIFIITLVIGGGVGFASLSVATPIYASRLFGIKNYAGFSSLLQIAYSAGKIIGPIVIGVLFSKTGSYTVSFYVALMYLAVVLLIWLFVLPRQGREPY